MPFKDPEKQKKYVREWSRDYQQRKKTEVEDLKKKIIELQKTINLMRIEHYPELPLIKLDN
jgi:hypothetical protein